MAKDIKLPDGVKEDEREEFENMVKEADKAAKNNWKTKKKGKK